MLIKGELHNLPNRTTRYIAREDVKKGSLVFDYRNTVVRFIKTEEEFKGLLNQIPEKSQELVFRSCYPVNGAIMYIENDSGLIQFSPNPNVALECSDSNKCGILALRDIKNGEELTCDYGCLDSSVAWFEKLAKTKGVITPTICSQKWKESHKK